MIEKQLNVFVVCFYQTFESLYKFLLNPSISTDLFSHKFFFFYLQCCYYTLHICLNRFLLFHNVFQFFSLLCFYLVWLAVFDIHVYTLTCSIQGRVVLNIR